MASTIQMSLTEARQVLGITANATSEEAKSSYKKQALKHHPDKNDGSEASTIAFQRVSHAYELVQESFQPKRPFQGMPGGGGGGGGGGMHFGRDGGGSFFFSFGGSPYGHGGGYGGGGPRGGRGAARDDEYDSYDEYDSEEYDDADDDDDYGGGGYGGNDFFSFMFEDIFRGGSGSRRNFNQFRHQRPQRPEAPKETDAERRARVAAEVQAIYEAEERRKEDAKREREERERLREEERVQGAARRDAKNATKKQKAAADKAGEASRIADRLRAAQETRSKVFAAARKGDSAAVKKGVWEDNVAASDGELLPGVQELRDEEQRKLEEEEEEKKKKTSVPTGKENVKTPAGQQGLGSTPGAFGAGRQGTGKGGKKKKGKKGGGVSTTSPNPGAPAQPSGATSTAPNGQAPPAPPSPPKPKGPDPKETLLHIAVKKGDTDLTEWLLGHGATADEPDSDSFTPLHRALQLGHLPIVSYFHSEHHSSFTDEPTPPNLSLLSLAVEGGHPDIVRLVVHEFVDVEKDLDDVWDNWGWIEDVQAGPGRKGEQDKWEQVKLALAELEGFDAPPGYMQRKRTGVFK